MAGIEVDFLLMDIQPLEPRIAFNQAYREEVPIMEAKNAATISLSINKAFEFGEMAQSINYQ